MTVKVSANTAITRSGTITFTSSGVTKTLTVTQPGLAAALALSQATVAASAAVGYSDITVTSNLAWTSSASASWLKITPTKGAAGARSVMVYWGSNTTGTLRIGTITFTAGSVTQTLWVVQVPHTLTLSPTTWNPGPAAASTAVSVSTTGTWTAVSNQSWLKISATSGTKGSRTVTVSVTANTGAARTGTITFTCGGVIRTVTVTQAGP
jgi:hypothetical protein